MFVCLEGIDDADKSKVAGELEFLLSRSYGDICVIMHNEVRTRTPFVDDYLDQVRALWRSASSRPLQDLGDLHWIHSKAGYYAAIDHCVVTPALRDGLTVLADGWFYGFAARMAGQAGSSRLDRILARFDGIRPPDRVFLLDVEPRSAASRRPSCFGPAESGPEWAAVPTEVRTQHRATVRNNLRALAVRPGWHALDGPVQSARHTAEQVMSVLLTEGNGGSVR